MALLWCDGFDHYGSTANMAEGVYASISSGTLDTSNSRTGTTSLRTTSVSLVRRVLGGEKTTVGLGAVFYYAVLPGGNGNQRLFGYRDAANADQVTIVLESTGIISARRGSTGGTILGQTAAPVITADTWQHVEAVVFFSQTVGTVEVRVNGVTVLSLSGQDTVNTSLVECSQVILGGGNGGSATTGLMDDVYCYDDTGSYNNAFLGDRRVITLYPDADTLQADWTVVGAASGYQAIDETNPDGDTSYLSSATISSPGQISEFGIENLPAGISAVNAVVLVEMARKTEAGAANTQWSIISGGFESAGADKPMTEVYTFRQDVFEVDPASAAPFTPAEVNSINIKVERTQ